jgi:hypothetical protein
MLEHHRTPFGIMPVATGASHPSVTAATSSAARRGRSADGGAGVRASAPSAHGSTASSTVGSTSPRAPYADNNTRISLLSFPLVLALNAIVVRRPPRKDHLSIDPWGIFAFEMDQTVAHLTQFRQFVKLLLADQT